MPRPESFTKVAWYDEVRQGFDFYFKANRHDLDPPPQAAVVEYFRSLAPEMLPEPVWETAESSPLAFEAEVVDSNPSLMDAPTISFLELPSPETDPGQFLTSDMKSGRICLTDVQGATKWELADIAANPCAVRYGDLDGNGIPDLLVTDLGSFLPEDHDRGKLVWVVDGEPSANATVTLLEGVGRVSDVRPGDFDGDGDLDLIVGVFGWHTTGGIHLLINEPGDDGRAAFSNTILDDRPGTIQLPTVDINEDGRLDFIALISQEHETVTAFLNEVAGFRKVPLFNAPDPAYGSSGIELVDLDLDGDIDILYTNGDTFDSFEVKPYHGISWLENQGDLQFEEHRLTMMPGVHRALVSDLDGDGDQDIAAVALLPAKTLSERDPKDFDSVIWLEQTEPGRFQRHAIEQGRPEHATLACGDFDLDGDVDLIAGNFIETSDTHSPATVFWNQLGDGSQSGETPGTAE